MPTSSDRVRVQSFRRLHDGSGILVLPGVWDVASARIFAAQGFPALGSTSSGVAWTLGYPIGQAAEWPVFLSACRALARAVEIPVSFDLEAGFATSPEGVCERVREAIEAGACGINIEDGFVDGRFAEASVLEDKLRAIRELCAKLDSPLFVNARTDVYLGGVAEETQRLGEAIRRAQRYTDAGADGLFVPGVLEPDAIATLAKETPLPLNVYALPGLPSAARLKELGARRVSLGCGPLQSVLARTRAIANAVRRDGDWGSFTEDWLDHGVAATLCAGMAS